MREELFSSGDLHIQTTYWYYFKSSIRNPLNLICATASNANTTGILVDIMIGAFRVEKKSVGGVIVRLGMNSIY